MDEDDEIEGTEVVSEREHQVVRRIGRGNRTSPKDALGRFLPADDVDRPLPAGSLDKHLIKMVEELVKNQTRQMQAITDGYRQMMEAQAAFIARQQELLDQPREDASLGEAKAAVLAQAAERLPLIMDLIAGHLVKRGQDE